MMRRASAIFLACFWWGAAARAEDISVPWTITASRSSLRAGSRNPP